jgi:hypothetical protein
MPVPLHQIEGDIQALPDISDDLAGRLQRLRSLEVTAPLTAALPESISRLQQLAELTLQNSEAEHPLPRSLPALQHLQKLQLVGCRLRALPAVISQLRWLQELELWKCGELHAVPSPFGNRLTSLQRLGLVYCDSLRALPQQIHSLPALQTLRIAFCNSLTALSDFSGDFPRLQHLYVANCTALRALPQSIDCLAALQRLDLSGCSALAALPDSVANLAQLQQLHCQGCSALAALPEGIGNLAQLRVRCSVPKCVQPGRVLLSCGCDCSRTAVERGSVWSFCGPHCVHAVILMSLVQACVGEQGWEGLRGLHEQAGLAAEQAAPGVRPACGRTAVVGATWMAWAASRQ